MGNVFGMSFFNSYEIYAGARSCIGRRYALFLQISNQIRIINYRFFFLLCDRFAETEAVAVLSILVSQFKMTIKEEPQFVAETFEQRKKRILSARLGLTLTWVILWMMMELILMNVLFSASLP